MPSSVDGESVERSNGDMGPLMSSLEMGVFCPVCVGVRFKMGLPCVGDVVCT